MITLRNKIFTLLKEIDDYNFDTEIFNFTDIKDHSNFSKLIAQFKTTKYVNPFYLWDIPKAAVGAEDEYIADQLEDEEL